jgi:orotate phosphoribosyltransferase
MTDDPAATGRRMAQILLDTGCILLRPERPFIFSSGWASPVYLDIPRALSFPLARAALLAGAEARILAEIGFDGFDCVAATEQGGIAIAAMLAERFHLPFVTVRRRAQGFGADAHIEGALKPGSRALLVSDVTTDGRSKAGYCRSLRRAGAEVTQIFVLFKYGVFDRVVTDIADGRRAALRAGPPGTTCCRRPSGAARCRRRRWRSCGATSPIRSHGPPRMAAWRSGRHEAGRPGHRRRIGHRRRLLPPDGGTRHGGARPHAEERGGRGARGAVRAGCRRRGRGDAGRHGRSGAARRAGRARGGGLRRARRGGRGRRLRRPHALRRGRGRGLRQVAGRRALGASCVSPARRCRISRAARRRASSPCPPSSRMSSAPT